MNIYKKLNWKNKILSVLPMISLIIFLIVGVTTKIWHPTWVVFLIIPLGYSIFRIRYLSQLLSVLIIISYLIAAFATGLWHPLWIMLLFIPVLQTLFRNIKLFNIKPKTKTKKEKNNNRDIPKYDNVYDGDFEEIEK